VLPLLGGILGWLLGVLDVEVEQDIDLPQHWQYSAATASTVLAAIVGAVAALTGFVVTVTVLVVQMATGSFSARYMRLWYRDRMLKALLAVLVGTFTFSFALLRQVERDFVPDLGVTVAGFLVVFGLLMFMAFLDRYLHRLRPVAVAALVADAGRRAFQEGVRAAATADAPDLLPEPYRASEEPALVVRSRQAGSIQALDGQGLVRWARQHNCLVVLPHAVGDFVLEGSRLIEVYGGKLDPSSAERDLLGRIALGVERTIEQDPAFAVRILVDIADLALSPAVNDPTTGVQVLDHLGDLLRLIGTTDLRQAERPGAERRWVVVRARTWEDFLALGVTEIRDYGARAIQVNRRLRAVLEELRDEVRPEHRPAVENELARLDASVARSFAGSPDLDRAATADHQGIGGPAVRPRPAEAR
jgi:uncharacterized membrane protein